MVLGLGVDVMDDGRTLRRIDAEGALAFLPRKTMSMFVQPSRTAALQLFHDPRQRKDRRESHQQMDVVLRSAGREQGDLVVLREDGEVAPE